MNDICVPLPRFEAAKSAHVEVRIENQRENYNYRVGAFKWITEEQLTNSLTKSHKFEETIQVLKSSIESHDKNWQLVQIYADCAAFGEHTGDSGGAGESGGELAV